MVDLDSELSVEPNQMGAAGLGELAGQSVGASCPTAGLRSQKPAEIPEPPLGQLGGVSVRRGCNGDVLRSCLHELDILLEGEELAARAKLGCESRLQSLDMFSLRGNDMPPFVHLSSERDWSSS